MKVELNDLMGKVYCDLCYQEDGNDDHDYPMVWNNPTQSFKCTKREGHYEDFETATSQVDPVSVFRAIEKTLLENNGGE